MNATVAAPWFGLARRISRRRTFLTFGGLVVALYILAPFCWLLLTSFMHEQDALSVPPQWIPKHPTLSNYQTFFDPSGTRAIVGSRAVEETLPGMVNSLLAALGTATVGAVLVEAERAPYIVGGIGYLVRGIIGGDSSGPRREHVVLTAEAGYIFGRARRWGQIWAGIRGLVPIAATSTQGSPLPDLPWALLTVRFLL